MLTSNDTNFPGDGNSLSRVDKPSGTEKPDNSYNEDVPRDDRIIRAHNLSSDQVDEELEFNHKKILLINQTWMSLWRRLITFAFHREFTPKRLINSWGIAGMWKAK